MSAVLQTVEGGPLAPATLGEFEKYLVSGDLSKLTEPQRVQHYWRVCESLSLNPYTQPFGYMSLNGKLQLYARKDCAEQLRASRKISITSLEGRFVDDLYIVVVKGRDAQGREDQATAAVSTKGLQGEAKANAIMKCETKGKRRLTLSMCGLGYLDESELENTAAQVLTVDPETGEILEPVSQTSATPPAPTPEAPKVPSGASAAARAAKAANPTAAKKAQKNAAAVEAQAPPPEEHKPNHRAAYWAIHGALGLPPHTDAECTLHGEPSTLKAINYEVWWKMLGKVYEGGSAIPEDGWAKLRRYLERMQATVQGRAEELGLKPMAMPQGWISYIAACAAADGQGTPIEAELVPDEEEFDPFADEAGHGQEAAPA